MGDEEGGVRALYQWQRFLIYAPPGKRCRDHVPVHEATSSQRNGIEPLAVLAELCPAARGPYRVSSEGQLELSDGLYDLSSASEGVLLRDQPGQF